jgi:hypothetical protein
MNKAILPLLTTRLPNVTSLRLQFNWNVLDGTQQAMMLSGFQKVTFMSLESCWFETSGEMNKLIASFPLLKFLWCTDTKWSKYAEPMIPLPHGINKIILSTYLSTFFDQLLSLEPHPNVRAIDFTEMEHMEEANKLLKTLGSCLEDFQVGKINS